MTILVEDLVETTTQAAEKQALIAFLAGTGIDATSWEPFAIERACMEMIAEMSARLVNALPAATIRNFYVEYAQGIALTYLADSHFDTTRIAGLGTRGTVTLTETAGDGPHTIDTSHQFRDPVSQLTFHVITGGALSASGTLAVTVECDTPGSVGNLANTAISEMVNGIAGVTVSNGLSGGVSWITRLGTNYEKDDVLRDRCETKFPTFSAFSPIGAYKRLVLDAVDGVGSPVGLTKVYVDASNPGGPGTVYIYVANQSATATTTQVNDTQAYIEDGRVSPAAIPTVIAATEVTVDFYGQIYVDAGYEDLVQDLAETAITEYIQGNDEDDGPVGLPLGGDQLDTIPGGAGFVLFDEIVARVKAIAHVRSFVLAAPSSNLALAGNNLAKVGVISLEMLGI